MLQNCNEWSQISKSETEIETGGQIIYNYCLPRLRVFKFEVLKSLNPISLFFKSKKISFHFSFFYQKPFSGLLLWSLRHDIKKKKGWGAGALCLHLYLQMKFSDSSFCCIYFWVDWGSEFKTIWLVNQDS